jgi:hypothetical protein
LPSTAHGTRKSNVIEALRLTTTPLNLRRTRYFDPDDLSHGRTGQVIELGLEFDGLTLIQQGQYYTALDLDTKQALYKARFRSGVVVDKRWLATNWGQRQLARFDRDVSDHEDKSGRSARPASHRARHPRLQGRAT